MEHDQDNEIQFTLEMGGSQEGDDYRFVGDEASLRRMANTILARLDGVQPLPFESDRSIILCEKIRRLKRKRTAFLSFKLSPGTDER